MTKDILIIEHWFYAMYILFAGILVQQAFSRLIFPFLQRYFKSRLSDKFYALIAVSVRGPVSFVLLSSAIYFAIYNSPVHEFASEFFLRLYRSCIILTFFAVLYSLSNNKQEHLQELISKIGISLDPILLNLVSSILHLLVVVLCLLTLAKEWNYDISGVVAGLGLGGLALAMASKDSLANIFSGFVILTDKPFSIGDYIKAADVEGSVENVTFRSTRVRTVEQSIIHVPNTNLANLPITNMSRRPKRRAKFSIGLTYSTSKEKLQACISDIKTFLNTCEDICHEDGDILVAFSDYGASSLNITIIFYTIMTDYAGHLSVLEKINFAIMDIVDKNDASMAFPSQSIYFETLLDVKK